MLPTADTCARLIVTRHGSRCNVSYTAIIQAFDRNKSPKLPGKSTIKDHGGWVDLLSFSWATSAGSTTSRTLSCVYSDAQNVSRELFDACATGTPFDTMVLKI